MIRRLAAIEDVPKLMQLVKKIVPLMRASGNFRWGDDYPNHEVFAQDIVIGQLWVAEIHESCWGFCNYWINRKHLTQSRRN